MNVKSGDLAIVVSADAIENIGIICRVGRYVGTDIDFDGIILNAWEVTTEGRKFRFVDGGEEADALINDGCLRPISGLPDVDATDEKINKPANVPEVF